MPAVQEVHERAGKKDEERQELHEVRAVLGDHIIADDADQREKEDAEEPGICRRLGAMMLCVMGVMRGHRSFLRSGLSVLRRGCCEGWAARALPRRRALMNTRGWRPPLAELENLRGARARSRSLSRALARRCVIAKVFG
jgi:hypothetical protein